MADYSSRVTTSPEHLAFRGAATRNVSSSSGTAGNGSWDGAGAMDQITVVRIDDTHIAEERSHIYRKGKNDTADCYEVESAEEEEEEDSVYVIEYSNPEEEGESYQFTMSVDRSHPATKSNVKQPAEGHSSTTLSQVTSRPDTTARQERTLVAEEAVKKEEVVSNKSVLELGEDYNDVMGSGKCLLKCSMCPPPGKVFKRASGLAVHLKQLHQMEGRKTFFCTYCSQTVRTQIQLDAHTRRHANHDAVFTCHLCSANKPETTGFKGSRYGLKRHLEREHPGVIPCCGICSKGFKTLSSYLADQFRHVGVSPYYCAKCQIYEMTERGLSVHLKNHNKKPKQESVENHLQTLGVSTSVDNSATDDSDF